MCSVVQNLKAEGRAEERVTAIQNMIELGLTKCCRKAPRFSNGDIRPFILDILLLSNCACVI